MKIVQISAFSDFSVGNIMKNLKTEIENNGDECYIFYGRGNYSNDSKIIKFNSPWIIKKNALMARIFDNDGLCDRGHTKRLIKKLQEIKPDIIHIHCLHGYYINYRLLFDYLKSTNIKVVWTMHDTWAFTGHCCYFDSVKCEKWEKGCFKCPAKSEYPKSAIFDRSKRNYKIKKEVFTSLPANRLSIVSPSKWLDGKVAQSFFSKYQHKVIYNGIDLSKFVNFGLQRKRIVLAVASVWDRRKNLEKILNVAKNLKTWKIIVVGKIETPINTQNLDNVTFIPRTTNLDELIKLYNEASVFINPTLDDNLPTVNIEAQLCGCNVLTYDVGGAIETDCGLLMIINEKNIIDDAYLDNVSMCEKRTLVLDKFDKSTMSNAYYLMYKEL